MDCDSISLWDGTAAEAWRSEGPLTGERSCDVAVIGAGFTGLSTALHCVQKGLSTHVLEAERVAHGGSGRNVGLVNAGLWLAPDKVEAALGAERGRRLVAELGAAPAYVMALIEQHGIACDLTRSGTIHAAHSPRGLDDLRARAAAWHGLGARVELLDRQAVAARVGSTAFHGGLFDPRAGTINPSAYARGLARAATQGGARISERSPVRAIRREGRRWRLACDEGALLADRVVICTNAYGGAIWPGLGRNLTIIHYFNLATEPLGARAAAILPERQGLWDTAPIMFSLRKDAQGRLVVGSMGRVRGRFRAREGAGFRGISQRFAQARLARLFPDLGELRFEAAWDGRIAMTGDHLPRIHRLAEGVVAPIGYNGRGITTGTMMGRWLADWIGSGEESALPLPLSAIDRAPLRHVRELFFETAFAANQIWWGLRGGGLSRSG